MSESASQTVCLWHFCALALAEPDAESLAFLREQPCQPIWLAAALDEIAALALDAWQGEHTRLFTFPALCPPFASAYLGDGTLFGQRATDLEDYYRALGLEAEHLPGDYLGTLCECAAFLAENAESDVRRDFFQHFFDDWLERFLSDLKRHSRLLFYHGLSSTLAEQLLASRTAETVPT